MLSVRGYIRRKSMLYETRVEYGDYTMNHIFGCAHGCRYPCYAFMMKRRFGEVNSYEKWRQPYLVENTIDLLDEEIPRLKSKIKSVQLCFTTDPFMYGYDEISEMSINAIKKLNSSGIACRVLTKGVLPRELANLSTKNEYGITLVSLDENFRKKMEPYSAPYKYRLKSLEALHRNGCKTWVSIEPYPTPNIIEQDLIGILEKVKFVNRIIFGKMNYNPLVSKYDRHKEFYNECADVVVNFCKKNGIQSYVKAKTISPPGEILTRTINSSG